MKKISTRFVDEIGIGVEINLDKRAITLSPTTGLNYRNNPGFVFINSKEETIRKIGEALIRIADLAKKELPKIKKVKRSKDWTQF